MEDQALWILWDAIKEGKFSVSGQHWNTKLVTSLDVEPILAVVLSLDAPTLSSMLQKILGGSS